MDAAEQEVKKADILQCASLVEADVSLTARIAFFDSRRKMWQGARNEMVMAAVPGCFTVNCQ